MAQRPSNPAAAVPAPAAWQHFVAGSASGAALVAAGHPFDTIKVRLQAAAGTDRAFRGPIDCLAKTLRHEGMRALYKGATPPLVATGGINSALFGMMGICKQAKLDRRKPGDSTPLAVTEVMLCGMTTGWLASTFVTPIENIKTKLQVQYGKAASGAAATQEFSGPIDAAKQIFGKSGVRGIYSGFVPTIFHRGSNWAYFGGYEFARQQLTGSDGEPILGKSLTAITAGAFAGTTFWLSCYPIDVIKGRMQAAPIDKPFRSMRHCAQVLYQADGFRGFFRGFTPCLLRSVPANSAAFLAFDFTMRQLQAF